MRSGLIEVLRFVRAARASLLPPSCRFAPSCFTFAEQAVATHGVARGSLLALRRLLHCHPWNPGGHDPVPGL